MLFGSSSILTAAEPQKEDAAFAVKLITAIEKSDYSAFVADGDSPFKQLKKEQFDAVSVKVAPRGCHELFMEMENIDASIRPPKASQWSAAKEEGRRS